MRLLWTKIPKPLEGAAKACRHHLLMTAGFSALINILYLAPTIYMMQVYDRVVPTNGLATLYWLTLIVGLAIGVLTALDSVRQQVMLRASMRLNRLLSSVILDRSMLRTKDGVAGAQGLREFDTLRGALTGPGVMALFDAPWAPLYLAVAFLIHPVLGMLVLVGGAILVVLAVANERSNRERAGRAHDAMAKAYAAQDITFRRSETVRALGMRATMVGRHARQRQDGLEAMQALQFSGARYNSLVKFVRMFMQSVALGVGALLAVKGEISVGAIIAASVLLSRALQPVEQLVGSWSQVLQAKQALSSIDSLFARTEAVSSQRLTLPPPEGHLELDRVVVRNAAGDAALLKSVSLKLTPGTIVGVVGQSGAGKSTLARVAAGAITPDIGEVRMDAASLADWDPDRLASYVGYLPQDCALLPGTIAENISRFTMDPAMPPEQLELVEAEVVRAAKMAGVHELILHFSAGYETQIEGTGRQLSAGQTQRVALARALFGNPNVLILDEPNSALDAQGEEALGRAVAAAKLGGAAVMVIAHKAAVLSTVDTLAILHDGEIARLGPRQEVLDGLAKDAAQANVVSMRGRAQ
jgi:ATP-binding cassette subfamily C protein